MDVNLMHWFYLLQQSFLTTWVYSFADFKNFPASIAITENSGY